MKVGEIIFYYSTGSKITEYYFSISERLTYIRTYKDCSYYKIIPYIGTGVANYLDTKKKCYAAAIPRSRMGLRYKSIHEIINQHKVA